MAQGLKDRALSLLQLRLLLLWRGLDPWPETPPCPECSQKEKKRKRKKKKGCIWSWDRGLCREDSSEKVRLCPDLQGEEGQASELSWNQGLEAGLHSQTGRTSSLQNSICFLQWSPCCPAASTLWLDAPSLPPPLQSVLRVTASN